jgi:UDP-N-acetylglucosamine 2-epimerase (non-hydrolysing)
MIRNGKDPLLLLVGARPNFVKLAPLVRALRRCETPLVVVHTGQHYDANMSAAFFRALAMPEPDVHLGIQAKSRVGQVGEIISKLENVFTEKRPRLVCVIGDVTSTLAAGVAAASADLPVAHIEAGLRSFDRSMPEEINRVMTDSITGWFFVSEPVGVEQLLREGQLQNKIHLVGDLIADALREHEQRARDLAVWRRWGLAGGRYAAATIHRPANVDDPESFAACLRILGELGRRMPVVFPMHPRTRRRAEEFSLAQAISELKGLIVCEPLDYLEFLSLLTGARLVLSDSGGIQLEATLLDLPCLTLRETTERPMTIEAGTNTLVGRDFELLAHHFDWILEGRYKKARIPPYWDGHTAERIAAILGQD